MSNSPSLNDLGYTGFLNQPSYITLAEDSGMYFTFITNLSFTGARSIIRNKHYGSLSGPIVPENLGNIGGVLPSLIKGIQVVKDNANN